MLLFRRYRLAAVWTALTIILLILTIVNTSVYFRPAIAGFMVEKGDLTEQPLWRTAFYFHIVSACVCLATGAILMFPRLLKFHRLHFCLGYIYLNSVLWIAAPTGLILAFNSKGGPPAGIGFVVIGVFWWTATWLGYRAIRRHNVESHICWMVRSYALALSALAFRVVHFLFEFAAVDYTLNYVLSVWISLLVSIALSEFCIRANFISGNRVRLQFVSSQKGTPNESFFADPVFN